MNNITKFLYALAVFSMFSTPLHASTRDGVYAGLALGGVRDQHSLHSRSALLQTTGSIDKDANSFLGGLFLGYGTTNDYGFYLAGELGTYWPSRSASLQTGLNINQSLVSVNNQLKITDNATLDLLPGIRFNESLLVFARAGLSYSEISIQQSPLLFIPPKTVNPKIGGRIGAGIHFGISNNVSAELDYTYTRYAEETFHGNYLTLSEELASNFLGISFLYTIQ